MHGEVDDILVTYKEEQWRQCTQILQKGGMCEIYTTKEICGHKNVDFSFKINVSFHLYYHNAAPKKNFQCKKQSDSTI